MAENSYCSRRSLQFHCLDPLSREATSRTMRYRIIKKRKAEENLAIVSADQFSAQATSDSEDDSIPQQSVIIGSDSEENIEVQSDCDIFSDEMRQDLLPEEPEVCDEQDMAQPIVQDETAGDAKSIEGTTDHTPVVSPFSLLIKQYSVRHNLTQAALADLLQLFRLHSATQEILPSSVYLFEKQFQTLKCPMTFL